MSGENQQRPKIEKIFGGIVPSGRDYQAFYGSSRFVQGFWSIKVKEIKAVTKKAVLLVIDSAYFRESNKVFIEVIEETWVPKSQLLVFNRKGEKGGQDYMVTEWVFRKIIKKNYSVEINFRENYFAQCHKTIGCVEKISEWDKDIIKIYKDGALREVNKKREAIRKELIGSVIDLSGGKPNKAESDKLDELALKLKPLDAIVQRVENADITKMRKDEVGEYLKKIINEGENIG